MINPMPAGEILLHSWLVLADIGPAVGATDAGTQSRCVAGTGTSEFTGQILIRRQNKAA